MSDGIWMGRAYRSDLKAGAVFSCRADELGGWLVVDAEVFDAFAFGAVGLECGSVSREGLTEEGEKGVLVVDGGVGGLAVLDGGDVVDGSHAQGSGV